MRFSRKLVLPSVWALSIVVAASGTAFAAAKITGAHIVDGSIKGIDIADGTITATDINAKTRRGLVLEAVNKAKNAAPGSANAPGAAGAPGANGRDGAPGLNGRDGANGADGRNGVDGANGANGKDAPAASYGAAAVFVKRATGAVVNDNGMWAKYSTPLGAPDVVGDDAGGTFRFTCKDGQVCTVSLKSSVLSEAGEQAGKVAARVVLTKQPIGGTGIVNCEYADGIDSSGAPAPITGAKLSDADPFTGHDIKMDVGSQDCGITYEGGARLVDGIQVGPGYYNVSTSFKFTTA